MQCLIANKPLMIIDEWDYCFSSEIAFFFLFFAQWVQKTTQKLSIGAYAQTLKRRLTLAMRFDF